MSRNLSFPFAATSEPPQPRYSGQQPPFDSRSISVQPDMNGQVGQGPVPQIAMAQAAGIDLSQFPPALVAQVLQAIQMGAIPMPPPPPPPPATAPFVQVHGSIPGQPHAQVPTLATDSAPIRTKVSPRQKLLHNPTRTRNVDADREGSEVEDGEVDDGSDDSRFLRLPHTSPRSRNSPLRHQANLNSSGDHQSHSYPLSDQATSSQTQQHRPEVASKEFILELHKAGYTYTDLAKELGDTVPLRRMFKQLGLMLPAEPTAVLAPSPIRTEPSKTSLIKRTAPPKPAATSDRTEYLKKLAAARNKTPARISVPQPPTAQSAEQPKSVSSTPIGQELAVSLQADSSSSKPVNKVDEATATAKRLLLKERLEALRAIQAAKNKDAQGAGNLSASPGAITTSVVHSNMPVKSSGLAPEFTKTAPQGVPTTDTPAKQLAMPAPVQPPTPAQEANPSPSTSLTPFRRLPGLQSGRLPGLPGLSGVKSATTSPLSQIAQPAPASSAFSTHLQASTSSRTHTQSPNGQVTEISTASLTHPAKRLAGSDFEAPSGTPRRPFGASRHNGAAEPFIIHTSDDDGDDDDNDDESAEHPSAAGTNLSQIEANMQRLREQIAAKLLAKNSKSNGKSPIGGATGSSGKATPVVAEPETGNHTLAQLEASTATEPSLNHFSHHETAPGAADSPTPNSRDHQGREDLPANTASQASGVNQSAATKPEDIAQMTFRASQDMEQSSNDSSSEDFYATTTHSSLLAAPADDGSALQDSYMANASESLNSDESASENSVVDHAANAAAANALQHEYSESFEPGDGAALVNGNATSEGSLKTSAPRRAFDSLASKPETSATSEELESDQASEADDQKTLSSTSRGDSGEVDEDEYEPEDFPTGSPALPMPSAESSSDVDSTDRTDMDLDQKPRSYFKPYVSHLRGFRDFRYHPDFLKIVPGGYKSLTYSNKIDPQVAFCPHESMGETCEDQACPWQHYGLATLNDNELLMSLGMAHPPVTNEEERQRWKEGLGALIRQLRLSNMGSDVNSIAAHICEYRRRFIGDDSQIIHLGS